VLGDVTDDPPDVGGSTRQPGAPASAPMGQNLYAPRAFVHRASEVQRSGGPASAAAVRGALDAAPGAGAGSPAGAGSELGCVRRSTEGHQGFSGGPHSRRGPAARLHHAGREERAMTANRTSYVYVGLAGETAPNRVVKSGLYRMAVGDDRWELVTRGLPEAPTIRAIATHPEHPEYVYVGTQHVTYRSTDHGEHWERLDIRDHGLPVWSLVFDPRDSRVLYAG